MLAVIVGVALVAWLGLLLVPWQPWRNRERLEAVAPGTDSLADVTVLIPARNEADGIAHTLVALQPCTRRGARVLVVDDQSTDATAARVQARQAVDPAIELLPGRPAPAGWSGKLWALQQGLERIDTPLVLLLDADIELAPWALDALRARLAGGGLAFVSVMATFSIRSLAERLLMPPFVYFFRLLYPFALANDARVPLAAAAGGCVLVRRRWLVELDAVRRIRGELIDDCALARLIKRSGGGGWVGISHGVISHRDASSIADIGNMIARNAFNQLGHSVLLLLVCTALMAALFVGPLAGLAAGGMHVQLAAGTALAAMVISFLPITMFYRGSPAWALTLPAAGMFYLAMTWLSAVRYWQGRQSQWRDRVYETGFGA